MTLKFICLKGCGLVGSRIFGGEEAAENQFPWQCVIKNGDGSFYGCGATLISCDPVIIISAAQCFQRNNAYVFKLYSKK